MNELTEPLTIKEINLLEEASTHSLTQLDYPTVLCLYYCVRDVHFATVDIGIKHTLTKLITALAKHKHQKHLEAVNKQLEKLNKMKESK